MRSIEVQIVREGDSDGVLERGRRYIFIGPSGRPRQFDMPIRHMDCLKLLKALRYEDADTQPQDALAQLAGAVTTVLSPEDLPLDAVPVHIDLVADFRELWVLPFEAAWTQLARNVGAPPLFAQQEKPMSLTRRMPSRSGAQEPLCWPARPRVLFVHASPAWLKAPAVPASQHREQLIRAFRPWFDPNNDPNIVLGDERTVLTELKDATLEDVQQACQDACDNGRPFTVVHILAHGKAIRDSEDDIGFRYGIALCSPDEKPTDPAALARALKPAGKAGGDMPGLPAVVSLACCDSANSPATFLSVGSVAQEIHNSGVPIVIGSQLPLTFPGSVAMTKEFYENWAKGADVRLALHKTRVALYEQKDCHDWVSLVAYVRLPGDYDEYLLRTRLQSQLAALESTSNHAKRLLENETRDASQYERVANILKQRIEQLDGFLKECGTLPGKTPSEVVLENTGLLGSAYKRLAELYWESSSTDRNHRGSLLRDSRDALSKAREVYRDGFLSCITHHWSGVQYLAIEAVLTGAAPDIGHWFACNVAATSARDHGSADESIWALGSLAELALLALADPRFPAKLSDARAALEMLVAKTKASPEKFPNLSPIVSTRRQFERYVSWWTAGNGFFGGRTDLAGPAAELVLLLRE